MIWERQEKLSKVWKKTMIKASLIGRSLKENKIFDELDPGNRDDCYRPYICLKKSFAVHGIELNTADVNNGSECFVVHQDVQANKSDLPSYLLLLESPVVKPRDHDVKAIDNYDLTFTWNTDLIGHEKARPILLPNPTKGINKRSFTERPIFTCMIAGNKAPAAKDHRELYGKRLEVIRWFEKNHPEEFHLYGIGWNYGPAKPGRIGKVLSRIERELNRAIHRTPFPSYQGQLAHKNQALERAKFSFCFENAQDIENYVTEKIFDSLFSGCIPIYLGAPNIGDLIPSTCYIDFRRFKSFEELYLHLSKIDTEEYRKMQENIQDFLNGPQFIPFSAEYFGEYVASEIAANYANR